MLQPHDTVLLYELLYVSKAARYTFELEDCVLLLPQNTTTKSQVFQITSVMLAKLHPHAVEKAKYDEMVKMVMSITMKKMLIMMKWLKW